MAIPKAFHSLVSEEYIHMLEKRIKQSPYLTQMLECLALDIRQELGSDDSGTHRVKKLFWAAQTMQENCGFDGQMVWYPLYVESTRRGNTNGLVRGYCTDTALGDLDGDLIHMELSADGDNTYYTVKPHSAISLHTLFQQQTEEHFDNIESAAQYITAIIIAYGVFNHD